jgi:hypothetical protein
MTDQQPLHLTLLARDPFEPVTSGSDWLRGMAWIIERLDERRPDVPRPVLLAAATLARNVRRTHRVETPICVGRTRRGCALGSATRSAKHRRALDRRRTDARAARLDRPDCGRDSPAAERSRRPPRRRWTTARLPRYSRKSQPSVRGRTTVARTYECTPSLLTGSDDVSHGIDGSAAGDSSGVRS